MKILLVCLLASLPITAQNKPASTFPIAKTIYVSAAEGTSLDLKAEITKKLNEWGKLQVVGSPDGADLILRVEQTRGFSALKGKGARGSALLTDKRSNVELWATSEGGDWSMSGYSIGKVGRKIANKLIKFYEKTVQRS